MRYGRRPWAVPSRSPGCGSRGTASRRDLRIRQHSKINHAFSLVTEMTGRPEAPRGQSADLSKAPGFRRGGNRACLQIRPARRRDAPEAGPRPRSPDKTRRSSAEIQPFYACISCPPVFSQYTPPEMKSKYFICKYWAGAITGFVPPGLRLPRLPPRARRDNRW